jgi:hypothetical protein
MVAVPARDPVSLIELVVRWAATFGVRRRAARPARSGPGVVARVWWFVTNLAGTTVALGAFTVGGFAAAAWVGWMVLGVSLLVFDFQVTLTRRKWRAER